MTFNEEDSFFTVAAAVVFFMQAGFAFLEAGSVRFKNTTSILFKNVADAIIGCVVYWAFGYAFAFGNGNGFIGSHHFFLSGIGLHSREIVRWMLQYVYAITAATIVSGAMAERTDFRSYLVYSFLSTGWVQPVVAHWGWSDQGWLYSGVYVESHNFTVRYEDFAGSSVVHVVGGTAALVGAALVGPRIGRFDDDGKIVRVSSYTTTMSTLGGFILIFGFFFFNMASHGSLPQSGDATVRGLIAANCMLASSGGAITTSLTKRYVDRKHGGHWSLVVAINGCITGLVSVSAGASTIYPYAAFFVGAIAGLAYVLGTRLTERWSIDDPLDAIAVHLFGGAWGVIAVSFLDAELGFFYKANKLSLVFIAWNLCGLVAIFIWTAMWSFIAFGLMSWMGVLRVTAEIEIKGLDAVTHGESAYAYLGEQKRKKSLAVQSVASDLSRAHTNDNNTDLRPTTDQLTTETAQTNGNQQNVVAECQGTSIQTSALPSISSSPSTCLGQLSESVV